MRIQNVVAVQRSLELQGYRMLAPVYGAGYIIFGRALLKRENAGSDLLMIYAEIIAGRLVFSIILEQSYVYKTLQGRGCAVPVNAYFYSFA